MPGVKRKPPLRQTLQISRTLANRWNASWQDPVLFRRAGLAGLIEDRFFTEQNTGCEQGNPDKVCGAMTTGEMPIEAETPVRSSGSRCEALFRILSCFSFLLDIGLYPLYT
jgi:hypothetical protein